MCVKTGKKLGVWLLICSLVLTGLTFMGERAYAAPTATFSVSGGEASLGGTVSVTVSVNGSENMAFAQVSLNYSANILEYQSGADSGGSGRVNLLFDCGSGQKSVSRTITFKAAATGKASLSLDNAKATPMDANSGDWMNASVSGGASVNVGEAKNLSADAHVASIEVSPGTLKPAFNTDVFKYTMEVENNVTSIAVTAKASHQAAKITAVNGASDLKVGANKVSIICTAENGGTAVYTITVTRKAAASEKPPTTTKPPEEATTAPPQETSEITCELNGAVYYVEQNFSEKSVPADFSIAEIQYQNQTIKGAQFNNNNEIQLIYLLNSEKKDGKFYMYYPASGLISELVQLSFYEGNYIYLLDTSAYGVTIPVDLTETTFQMDDRELPGYVLVKPKAGVGEPLGEGETDIKLENVSASPEQFVLLFGLSKDGSVSWYTYDKQEKTLQRMVVFASEEEKVEEVVETSSDGSENAVKKMLATLKTYRIILLGAAAIIVLLIILCVLIGINAKRKAGDEEEDDYEMIYKSFEDKKEEKEKLPKAKTKKETEPAKRENIEATRQMPDWENVEAAKQKPSRENVDATRQMPDRETWRKTEKTEQAEPVPEKKVSEKAEPKAKKKVSEKAAAKAEKKVSEKSAEKPAEKPEKKHAGNKKASKQAEDDLELEIFDIDDL